MAESGFMLTLMCMIITHLKLGTFEFLSASDSKIAWNEEARLEINLKVSSHGIACF